jgi:hypothetical protein
MKTQRLFAASALAAAAFAAGAQEATLYTDPPSTLTRAEVQAELARARAAGELDEITDWLTQRAIAMRTDPAQQAVARSRADVQAEAMAAAHTRSFEFDPGSVGG